MTRPITIGIAGSHSGVGKTTMATALLKEFQSLPPNPKKKRWGAIKYTKTAFYSSIIDDKAILSDKEKDTGRLLDAGAEEVLWMQSPEAEIQGVLSIAMDRLSYLDGIIIEGNTAIEFLKPDIVIFIENPDSKIKPSAERVLKQADIIIKDISLLKVALNKTDNKDTITPLDSHHTEMSDIANSNMSMQEISDYILTIAKKKNAEGLLKERSVDGKIACSDARKIAEELGVSYMEVGGIANKLSIKIKNCELGCF